MVTVADDGGSSGRLRDELGVLPPGDLRMALAALCDDGEWGRTWRDVLQHRFAGDGALAGHAVGNLLIVALWELLGDPVAGLDWVGRLLGARGRVLPMAAVPLEIEADVVGARPGRPDALPPCAARRGGHDAPAGSPASGSTPDEPPAVPEAVAAVLEADWVVLGPGSWFTSVLPHLLVPELRAALRRTTARALRHPQPGRRPPARPTGFSRQDHLEVLAAHAPDLRLDVVLADPASVDDDDGAAPRPPGARSAASAGVARDGRPARPAAPGRGLRDVLAAALRATASATIAGARTVVTVDRRHGGLPGPRRRHRRAGATWQDGRAWR